MLKNFGLNMTLWINRGPRVLVIAKLFMVLTVLMVVSVTPVALVFNLYIMPDTQTIWERVLLANAIGAVCVIFFIVTVADWFSTTVVALQEEREKAAEARREIELLYQQRGEFVAYVSHEIRNPLNAIMGITGSIEEKELSLENRKKLATIRSSSDDLMQVLNDVLDLSQVDRGRVEFEAEPVSLRGLIENNYQFWQAKAAERGLKLLMSVDPDVPQWIKGDAYRLRQILNNLVSNAIKYTDKGSVTIRAQFAPSQEKDAPDMVRILIVDTGRGVPHEKRDTIFEMFGRVREREGQAPQIGTGLGLPIARRLARLMGGDVELSESSAAGSTFEFIIVAEESAAPKFTATDSLLHIPKGARALVADDLTTGVLVAKQFLTKFGLEVDTAKSGQEAIEKVKASHYHLLMLDDDLGDMHSKDVLVEILPAFKGKLLAYTGKAESGARRYFLDIGFDGYVVKPLREEELKSELAAICDI